MIRFKAIFILPKWHWFVGKQSSFIWKQSSFDWKRYWFVRKQSLFVGKQLLFTLNDIHSFDSNITFKQSDINLLPCDIDLNQTKLLSLPTNMTMGESDYTLIISLFNSNICVVIKHWNDRRKKKIERFCCLLKCYIVIYLLHLDSTELVVYRLQSVLMGHLQGRLKTTDWRF